MRDAIKTKIIIADDHKMMRDGLRALLEREPDIDLVGEIGDGRSLLALIERTAPDVVIMDIGMPELNGIEATRNITRQHRHIKVVVLSAHVDKRYVLAAIEAGASGYVVKSDAGDELLRAIHTVRQGRKYLSTEITGLVVEGFVGAQPNEVTTTELGTREREVLQLLAEGNSSPEIAKALYISVATVEAHRRNIMKKLDLHSVAELTKYAIREGLTTL